MTTIHRTHHYTITDIKHDAVVAQAFAESEQEVREMAKAQGFDLEGCEIEMIKENPRDMLGRSIAPRFDREW